MSKKIFLVLSVLIAAQFSVSDYAVAQDILTPADEMIIAKTEVSEITSNSAKIYWQSTSFPGNGEYRYSKVESKLSESAWQTDGVINGEATGSTFGSMASLNNLDADFTYYVEVRKGRNYGASGGLYYGPSKMISFVTLYDRNKDPYTCYKNRDGKWYYDDRPIAVADAGFKVLQSCYYAKDNSNVYFKDQEIKGADPNSFKLLTLNYSVDENNCYYNDYHSDKTYTMSNCQSDSLRPLSEIYAKDKVTAYYLGKKMDVKDIATFRAKSGGDYAEDKYTYYNNGAMTDKKTYIYERVKGRIVIKTEDNGAAYYVHPRMNKIFYLGRPDDAFKIMREQSVGITNIDLQKIPIGLGNLTGSESPDGLGKLAYDSKFTKKQNGKILLQVQNKGEAWYVINGKRYFLGRPADAFSVMRNLGLGISNNDFVDLQGYY
ncbi:MAG: DKNYY domain-containing protein [bacterium]|nr:DKNYY domain-containing protein [bacterium]